MAKLTHVSYFKKINYIYSTYCCFDALPEASSCTVLGTVSATE